MLRCLESQRRDPPTLMFKRHCGSYDDIQPMIQSAQTALPTWTWSSTRINGLWGPCSKSYASQLLDMRSGRLPPKEATFGSECNIAACRRIGLVGGLSLGKQQLIYRRPLAKTEPPVDATAPCYST